MQYILIPILQLPVLLEVIVLQAWSGGVGVVSETLQAGSIDSCWLRQGGGGSEQVIKN